MLFQETDEMCGYDPKKGTGKDSSNYSPYNMNMHFLREIGCGKNCATKLGQKCGKQDIEGASKWMLKAMRGKEMGGPCGVLNFHRGGSTTWKKSCGAKSKNQCDCDSGSGDPGKFREAIWRMTETVMENPEYLTDGTRLCMNTAHHRL